MKVIMKTTREMAKENMFLVQEITMKGFGKTINMKEKVFKYYIIDNYKNYI